MIAATANPPISHLRALGKRTRSGPVTLVWAPPDECRSNSTILTTRPTVAFAVGRKVGTAVVRNRIRRRIRAALRELPGDMPLGTYLFSARREVASMSFTELVGHLDRAVREATSGG